MNVWSDAILVLVVLTSLLMLGSSRLGTCVRLSAVQGLLLAVLVLVSPEEGLTWHAGLLAGGTGVLKGFVFPRLLGRALREAGVRREVEPFVGFSVSILVGGLLLGVSLWLGRRLPLPQEPVSSLLVPVAFFAMLVGLFLIVSRRKALTQVVGYLTFENGIFLFGVGLTRQTPLMMELGVLLDVFVAVFVMGIAIFHISREFDHIDTDRLSLLKD